MKLSLTSRLKAFYCNISLILYYVYFFKYDNLNKEYNTAVNVPPFFLFHLYHILIELTLLFMLLEVMAKLPRLYANLTMIMRVTSHRLFIWLCVIQFLTDIIVNIIIVY